jgi:hypothetical protein
LIYPFGMATSRIYDWGSGGSVAKMGPNEIARATGQQRGIVDKWLDSKPIQEARMFAETWQKEHKQRAFPLLKNVSISNYEATQSQHLKVWIEHCDGTAEVCRALLGLEEDDDILDEDLRSMARIIEIAYNRPPVPGAKPPPTTPKPRGGAKRVMITAASASATSCQSPSQTPAMTGSPRPTAPIPTKRSRLTTPTGIPSHGLQY